MGKIRFKKLTYYEMNGKARETGEIILRILELRIVRRKYTDLRNCTMLCLLYQKNWPLVVIVCNRTWKVFLYFREEGEAWS